MFLRIFIVLVDIFAVLAGLFLSHQVTLQFGPKLAEHQVVDTMSLLFTNPHMPAGLTLTLAWLCMVFFTGGYTPSRMTSSPKMMTVAARSAAGVFVIMLVLQFTIQGHGWSRFLMIAFTVSSATTVGLARIAFLKFQRLLPRSVEPRKLAIIGTGKRALQMAERISDYGHDAFDLVGFIEPSGGTNVFEVSGKQILGEALQLDGIVSAHRIEMVILATTRLNRDEHVVLANRADKMGLHLLEMPSNWGLANPRMALHDLGDLALVDLTTIAYPFPGALLKRGLDLVIILTGGLLLLPFLLFIGLAIRLTDGGPALFTQSRCGHAGIRFEMFKFRSMVVNAESMRAELAKQNDSGGVLFKMREDPRVASIGKRLRRWSIDELPQILNVLKGDMNLVGPRPLPFDDVKNIERNAELTYWFSQRSKVKPGITGTWQVSDRRDLKMEDMVRLDIDYIQNWSIWGDILLLIRTIPAVLRGRGSH